MAKDSKTPAGDGDGADQALGRKMTFGEHLDELRTRLLRSLIALALLTAVALFFQDQVVRFVVGPFLDAQDSLREAGKAVPKLIGTSPTEGWLFYFKVAMYAAMVAGMPVFLHEMWKFVAAGLYPHEQKKVMRTLPVSLALFLAGALFAYYVLLPIALDYLMGFGDPTIYENQIKLDEYFGFFLLLCVLLGAIFQLPLLQVILARFGVVTVKFMREKRRHFIMGAMILAAIATPTGDPMTLLLVAGPMVVLFEIGLWCAVRFEKTPSPQESD